MVPAKDEPKAASAGALIGFYVLYFMTVGVTLPFLPAYFKSLGFTGTEVGLLLGLNQICTMVAPPLWGHLADRSGNHARVLKIISVGALVAFAPLYFTRAFLPTAAVMFAYAVFASSVTTVVDTLSLQRVSMKGGSYGHLRLFGSLGFVLSSTAFGFAVDEVDGRAVLAALFAIALYAGWTLTLSARSAPSLSRNPFAGFALLSDPELRIFLAATCLHWVSCAPYHGSFAIHVTSLGLPPWVVGVSVAGGVLAEVGVMLAAPLFGERLTPRRLLVASVAFTILRWGGLSVVESEAAIISLSLLHGFTFGAFYVASVAFIGRKVPATMRASGQALFVSLTFGVGGLVGYLVAGVGYDLLGGPGLFLSAALLELVPLALLFLTRSSRISAAPGTSAAA